MRVLLDTHALLWAAAGDPALSAVARRYLTGKANEILVSVATAWEITTKVRLGRLPDAAELVEDLVSILREAGYVLLPISAEHALRAGLLPGKHRDPFDRMLAAQALIEGIPLLSNDRALDAFGVRRVW